MRDRLLDTRMVLRWLPLYELCTYSRSCNRAVADCRYSQATLNRVHRCLEELLAEAESRHLFDLLDTLRTTAQKMRTAEGVCRVESGVPWSGVIPSAPPPRLRRGGPRTSGDRLHG